MSKRIFTQEQIASLRENKHVASCSEKSITYRASFKFTAIKRYQDGLSPSAIFSEAGFNLALIGRKNPKWLVTDWRKIFDAKGAQGLRNDGRGQHSSGRPPDFERMSEKEKLKYLKAQVAYLKKENAFLAQLRKQRLNYDLPRNSELSDH